MAQDRVGEGRCVLHHRQMLGRRDDLGHAVGQVLFQPKAEVVHLGHTSQEHPLKVEFHKGVGLTRYFIKRADSLQLFAAAVLLAPAIMLMSVSRPLLWKLTGRPI